MLIQHILMLADVVFMCVVLIFNFTRSGAIDLNTGSVRLVGINSNAWSRTVFTNVHHAYDSALNAQNIYASAYDVYWFGFFARCLTDRL